MKVRITTPAGITLIEMMIAVAIISIVSFMAVPRFQKAWERIRIRSVNRGIVSTLRLARSMAISDKEQYGVFVDNGTKTITLFKDIVNPGGLQFETGDLVIRTDTLSIEFNYIGTDIENNVIVFQPNGSAEFIGGGNIVTMATTGSQIGIYQHNVLASTGRVQTEYYFY
ncbi:MAG: Tfp pilus assembly protein FimT/FimU [Candidatus Zixiibacteriota bacterium]